MSVVRQRADQSEGHFSMADIAYLSALIQDLNPQLTLPEVSEIMRYLGPAPGPSSLDIIRRDRDR